jgi:hypothetical protein
LCDNLFTVDRIRTQTTPGAARRAVPAISIKPAEHYWKLPEITQYCSAGFVLGPFFEAKALRTLRVDRVKDKDLSVELNLGKARPGEGRA